MGNNINNDKEIDFGKRKKWFKQIKDSDLNTIFYIPFSIFDCENMEFNYINETNDSNNTKLIFYEELNEVSNKVFRMNRFNISQNSFDNFVSFEDINLFYYNSLFNNWDVNENDFLKRFIYHIRFMDDFSIENYSYYLLNKENNFSFEDLKKFLNKEFSTDDRLKPYITNYLDLMNENNIFEILTKIITDEGELYNYIINKEKNNLVIFTLLFYFIIDLISNLSNLLECNLYAYMFDTNDIFDNKIFTPGNLITNKNFISVTKNKQFFNKKNHIEITIDKNINKENKFFYLNSKIIDISILSLFKKEGEVIIEPNSIFEIEGLEKNLENNTFKLKLKLLIDFKGKYLLDSSISENIKKKFGQNIIYFTGISYYNILNRISEINQIKNIISLDFSNCGLNDNELSNLTPYICNFTFLQNLDLSENNLTDISLENLSNIFSFIQYLDSLNLSHNNFSDSGIKILSENIYLLKYLINLNLISIHLSHKGIKSLSKNIFQLKKIKRLNISYNSISTGIDLFSYYISNITNLSYLNLAKNNILDENIYYLTEKFQYLPKLTYINLSENYIKSDGMKSIFDNLTYLKELRYLILYGNKIGIEGAKSLSEHYINIPNIKVINLGFNIITDEQLMTLSNNIHFIKNIETLIFRENAISTNGINDFLTKLSQICFNIKEIDFSWNKITEECFDSLIEFNKSNKYLNRINLNNNNIKNMNCLQFLVNLQNINLKWTLLNKESESEEAEFIIELNNDKNIIQKYFT